MAATSVPRVRNNRDVDPALIQDGGYAYYNPETRLLEARDPVLEGGLNDRTYVHTQVAPSATWSMPHNMGKVPNWVVLDSTGEVVHGDPIVVTTTQLTLQFGSAFSGVCYLN